MFHERGHAEAEIATLATQALLLGSKRFDVDVLERALVRLVRGEVADRRARDHLGGQIGAGQQVAPADDVRLDTDGARHELQQTFSYPRLGCPRAAVSDHGCLVGCNDGRFEREVANAVGVGEHDAHQ